MFGRPKKYGPPASSVMAGVGNGFYTNNAYSGSLSLPRINSDNDISAGSENQNDINECEIFVEHLDLVVLNEKFEEMLVKQFFIVMF